MPYLQPVDRKVNVERELEWLQEEADRDPERHRQLAAVRFYIRYALHECQRHWRDVAKGVDNYKTLLDQIRHYKAADKTACLVRFNYDTLLEEALPSVGVQITTIDDYISNPSCAVVKVHGSIDWGRRIDTTLNTPPQSSPWEFVQELTLRANELTISQQYYRATDQPVGMANGVALFPAIAIPLERKRDFECPVEHMDFLTKFLPKVTRVLIVGWRAADQPFVDLMRTHLPMRTTGCVVAGCDDDAREIVQRLEATRVHVVQICVAGFSDFVVNRHAKGLLEARTLV